MFGQSPLLAPLFYTSFYVLMAVFLQRNKFILETMYKTNQKYSRFIKNVSIVHNTGLVLFSGYTFVALCYYLMNDYGTLHPSAWLADEFITNPQIENLCWLFTYSKIWEFLDTFLILLKGQNTIFLQKYHHFGAVWVWYLLLETKAQSVLLPTFVNSFVHTFMYLYYLLCLFGLRYNSVKPFITLLQLFQLSSGVIVTFYYYALPRLNNIENPTVHTTLIFISYVLVLIVLFINFALKTYIKKKVM